jgi:16S rRNA uridine-516 pseudouridylate synthase and related pseudouridylate synthases
VGWVRVDGQVVEAPQFMVDTQSVELDPQAELTPAEPATLVLHKPAGSGPNPASVLVMPENHWADDPSGVRPLQRHLQRLASPQTLPDEASGLLIFTQDWRVARKLNEDMARIELEFVVDVRGELIPERTGPAQPRPALQQLCDAADQGELAERAAAALRLQAAAAKPDQADVRGRGPHRAGDEAPARGTHPAGRHAAGTVALPGHRRAHLSHCSQCPAALHWPGFAA